MIVVSSKAFFERTGQTIVDKVVNIGDVTIYADIPWANGLLVAVID